MRILAELHSLSYIGRPNLFPLLVRKQLDLTLAHGHTPSLPVVLASYGVATGDHGDRDGAQRFGEVAMQLAERPEFREARPQTMFLHYDFIHHWRHPIRDSLGPLRDAITEALDQGDQEYAGWLAAVLLGQSFWAGRPLAEIDVLARSLIPEIRSQPGAQNDLPGHPAVWPQHDGPQRRPLPYRRRKRLRRARCAACGPRVRATR